MRVQTASIPLTSGLAASDLLLALKRSNTHLPYQVGAFIALEVCEALHHAPGLVDVGGVRLTADGGVAILGAQQTTDAWSSAESVRVLLAQLLLCAAPGVPPLLVAVADQNTGGSAAGKPGLEGLHDALMASLVPLNRDASRRTLSRLVRQATEHLSMPPPPQVDASALDAELDVLLDTLDHSAAADPMVVPAAAGARASSTPSKPPPLPEHGREASHRPSAGLSHHPAAKVSSGAPLFWLLAAITLVATAIGFMVLFR